MTLLKNNSKKYSSFLVHATEKEHLDLRRELEAQIRVKDEDCRKFQAQLTQLKSTRYIYFNSIFNWNIYTANILIVENTTSRGVIFPMHFQCLLGI